MNDQQRERIEHLLKQSLPGMSDQPGAQLRRDLWASMSQRIADQARPLPVPWFDWALLAVVAAWLAFFPSTIPVLLYHL